MIRLLKEHYWQEAYAGVGSIEGNVIVGDKMYVPRVRERLQYWSDLEHAHRADACEYGWEDVPTVESPLPEPPNA